jgi:uncharacterized tellurite resistance protein B-like protein
LASIFGRRRHVGRYLRMKLIDYLADGLRGRLQSADDTTAQQPVRLAAAVLLVELSRGHPNARSNEVARIVTSLREAFLLDDEAARTLLALGEQEAKDSIDLYAYSNLLRHEFSEEQKESLLRALWRVALVDDAIEHYEEQYIAKVAALLAVPNVRHLLIKDRILAGSFR